MYFLLDVYFVLYSKTLGKRNFYLRGLEDSILECTYIFSVLRAASFIYLYHLFFCVEEISFSRLVLWSVREGRGKPLRVFIGSLRIQKFQYCADTLHEQRIRDRNVSLVVIRMTNN